jgi:phosphoglycerate dehydrogenase-like enzyme
LITIASNAPFLILVLVGVRTAFTMTTTSDQDKALKQLHCTGIVGAGNMGTQMAIAFSEMGLGVSVWDVNEQKSTSYWTGRETIRPMVESQDFTT